MPTSSHRNGATASKTAAKKVAAKPAAEPDPLIRIVTLEERVAHLERSHAAIVNLVTRQLLQNPQVQDALQRQLIAHINGAES
jgi:hypothetical protein